MGNPRIDRTSPLLNRFLEYGEGVRQLRHQSTQFGIFGLKTLELTLELRAHARARHSTAHAERALYVRGFDGAMGAGQAQRRIRRLHLGEFLLYSLCHAPTRASAQPLERRVEVFCLHRLSCQHGLECLVRRIEVREPMHDRRHHARTRARAVRIQARPHLRRLQRRRRDQRPHRGVHEPHVIRLVREGLHHARGRGGGVRGDRGRELVRLYRQLGHGRHKCRVSPAQFP